MAILKNATEVAIHYGRTPRAIRNWIRAGLPRQADGRFDSEKVDMWLRERRYLGSSLRALAADQETRTLFEMAVFHLRRGLKELVAAYVLSRGKNRARLLDEATRDILHGVACQQSLLEGEKGGGRPFQKENNQ